MVLRRTVLERWWKEGRVRVLSLEEYVAWLADFVERLDPRQTLHRLHADAAKGELVAPEWTPHANDVRHALDRELERRGTRQGSARAGAGGAVSP
jgi:radical SAM superfamily enzyme